jgi:hypothetical protein
MNCDPTWEVCTSLQGGPGGPPPAGGPPAADAPANASAGSPAPAGNGTANGTAPAKKGNAASNVTKAEITEIAVRFVNAMWATMFAKTLSIGLQQRYRTISKLNSLVSPSTADTTSYTSSVAYKSYLYSSWLLIGWGLFGWTAFLSKRFVDSNLTRKLAYVAARGNGVAGLCLAGLSIWKTASRD